MTHLFTSDVRFLLLHDFMTAVSRIQIQIADEIADIIKGGRQLYDDGTVDVYAVRCLAKQCSRVRKTLAR